MSLDWDPADFVDADDDLVDAVAEVGRSLPGHSPHKGNGGYKEEYPPTLAVRKLPDPPPWPAPPADAAFHGLAGEFVRILEPHTEADPVAVLLQFLTMFGNVIGRSVHAVVEADRHHTNLFVGIVGTTAKGRKGVSQGQAQRPFEVVDQVWSKEHVQGGLSSGEGLIWAVRDPVERQEPVKEKGRVVGYQTVIADPGISDKRLLVFEPELAATLRVIGRDGNTLSPIIRQAWDRGDLRSMVKNNPAKATDVHVSIVGHITKGELVRYLDATEKGNGFANRFLWVCARRSKMLPRGGALHRVDFAPFMRKLSAAVDHAKRNGERAVSYDDEAGNYWDAIYGPLSEGGTGMAAEVTSRAEAQVLRLALIYAALDGADAIRLPHLQAAEAVWRYCEASVRYIFGDTMGDPVADEILAELRRVFPRGLTRTELSEYFGRHRRSDQIGRALATLEERGLIRMTPEKTGGRTAERWYATSGCEISEKSEGSGEPAEAYRAFCASFAGEEGKSNPRREGNHEAGRS